tara:strand:+ start:262 stop:1422 length:1161 start_codon:yes stop_codon:yes gene_type:complete
MKKILESIVKPLKKISSRKMYIHEPDLYLSDVKNLKTCVKERNVSASGNFVKKFEKEIIKITKSKYVVSTNSGTSALHIACLLSDIKKNDEVLLPTFTFVASAHAIIYCDAVPHFIDIEENHFGIDFIKLRNYLKINSFKKNQRTFNKKTKRPIKAIMAVHPLGYPLDCDELRKIAKEFNLIIIEDAADSLGSYFKGKHTGTFGKFGVLSFNGNKILTTGSGGAILTSEKKMAEKARKLVQTAKISHSYKMIHDEVGYNYRLSNINAALGLSQIKRFNQTLRKKRKIFRFYNKAFKNNEFFDIVKESKNKKFNYWLQTIIIKKKYKTQINIILKGLIKNKIIARQGWELMTSLKHLKKYPKMKMTTAQNIQPRIINLPSSSFILDK